MALFEQGKQFPPQSEIERLASYKSGELIYRGKDLEEVYTRYEELEKRLEEGIEYGIKKRLQKFKKPFWKKMLKIKQ